MAYKTTKGTVAIHGNENSVRYSIEFTNLPVVYNIPQSQKNAFVAKLPTYSIAEKIRALITLALSMTDERFAEIVNQQVALDAKNKAGG